MGLISQIYLFFETFLNTIDEIKSVDLFFNQFETQTDGESDARANPRVLIQINEFEPIQNFGGIQNWVGEVTLFVGIDIINTFYSGSELQGSNLAYLELLDTIYQKLQGISSFNLPDEIRDVRYRLYNVERSKVTFAFNEGPIKVSEISFRVIVEDNSNADIPIEDNIDAIDLEIEFNRD